MAAKAQRIAALVLLAGFALLASTNGLAATARDNFNWYCAQCHGSKGAGDGVNSTVKELPVGPMNLSVSKEVKKFSDADIIKTVTHGGPVNRLDSLMPPWGNRLTGKEIKELMRYVRGLCKGPECPKERISHRGRIARIHWPPCRRRGADGDDVADPGVRVSAKDGVGRDIHVETRRVDVAVRRLRQALNKAGGSDLIRTVRGAGYAIDTGDE